MGSMLWAGGGKQVIAIVKRIGGGTSARRSKIRGRGGGFGGGHRGGFALGLEAQISGYEVLEVVHIGRGKSAGGEGKQDQRLKIGGEIKDLIWWGEE